MAPSDDNDIPWLIQPDLFLLSQNGVAQVWKCKRTISEAVLMKRKDFVYVTEVENHLDLVKQPMKFDWPEDGYKELVKYISERRLLVNGQGLVIAELPKFNPDDGKMDERASPLFMWSLDILALDTYMQHYIVRPIPFRPIQYLEDKNGPARDAEVELSPNEIKLTKDLEKENNDKKALEKEVADLKITKKGLIDQVAKLEKDLAAKTKEADAAQEELDRVKSQLKGRVADLEGKNRDLDGRITRLTAELAELRRRIAELRKQLIGANNDKDALGRKIAGLQDQLDTLINKNKNRPEREHWMNDYYESDWVDYYELVRIGFTNVSYAANLSPNNPMYNHPPLTLTGEYMTFREDNSTNVGKKYFCELRTSTLGYISGVKAVDVSRLSPNGYAKARFDPKIWGLLNNKDSIHLCRNDNLEHVLLN